MPSIFDAIKKVFLGNKEPEEVFDSPVVNRVKELIVGKESKISKGEGVESGGSTSPASAQTGTSKIGAVAFTAQKDEELVNSAIRDIRSGKYTTQEQKAAIERLQARIDKAVTTGVVPSLKDQHAFLNLREARAYGSYLRFKEEAKLPNAPAIVKDIASRPYQKDMTNPWKNFKEYDIETVLKVYGVTHPENLSNKQKELRLEKIMREHEGVRTIIEKKNQDASDVQNSSSKYKQYPNVPLNPRISKVIPFVDENTVYLQMTVDGKEKNLAVSNKNVVDAYHAGALPLNYLANYSLAVSENRQADLQNYFEKSMDAFRSQDQNQFQGFRR